MARANSYDRPHDLADALSLLAKGSKRIVAGCTDVFAATEAKTLPGAILDLTNVHGLRGITALASGDLRIGATTTWTDIARADLPPALHALQQAALQVGACQVQNRGTLAGNLCNASPAADGVPPLLVVDAMVEITSHDRQRLVPLAQFITGPRHTSLQPEELVTAIIIPDSSLKGHSHFEKLGARAYLVISIAMVALRVDLDGSRIRNLACAVGACGPVATRLTQLETVFKGADLADLASVDDALVAADLSPIDDIRADAGYRRHSAAELVRRAGITLLSQAEAAA